MHSTPRGTRVSPPVASPWPALLLAILAAGPSGCAERPRLAAPTAAAPVTREAFFAGFRDTTRRIERLRARVYLDWHEPGRNPRTLTGDLFYDRAKGFRIRGGFGTIAAVFDLAIRGDEFLLLDALNLEAVVSDSADSVLEELGHPFLAAAFLDAVRLATGSAPPGSLEYRTQPGGIVTIEGCSRPAAGEGRAESAGGLDRDSGNTEIALLRYDGATRRLTEARLGCPAELTLTFAEYRRAGKSRIPYRVMVKEASGEGRLVIRFRSVQIDPRLSASTFDLHPPARFLVLGRAEIAERFQEGLLSPPTELRLR